MRHAWYEESKTAYALRALPEDGLSTFEAHLPGKVRKTEAA